MVGMIFAEKQKNMAVNAIKSAEKEKNGGKDGWINGH